MFSSLLPGVVESNFIEGRQLTVTSTHRVGGQINTEWLVQLCETCLDREAGVGSQ